MRVRGNRRHQYESIDDEFNAIEPVDQISPADLLTAKQHKDLMNNCIDALSYEHRECIVLHYFGDHSIEEICSIQQVKSGTVKSRLFHARQSIKRCLVASIGLLPEAV
jgi:RNA polymerase sigma-70 factor (ECF subfamily)